MDQVVEKYTDALRKRLTRKQKSSMNRTFIRKYLQGINTPRALCVWLLFDSGEHDQLVSLGFDPDHYTSVSECDLALRATKFLSKYVGLKTTFDLTEVALAGFYSAEEACKRTNLSLKAGLSTETPARAKVIHLVKRKILSVLGEKPCIDMVLEKAGWGPGVTQELKGFYRAAANKFGCENQITKSAYDVYSELCTLAFPNWKVWSNPVIVASENHVIAVPKNAKTHRIIAIEPGLNLYLQKGFGALIRLLMKRSLVNCLLRPTETPWDRQ